jgi:hypothetical protein
MDAKKWFKVLGSLDAAVIAALLLSQANATPKLIAVGFAIAFFKDVKTLFEEVPHNGDK